MNISGNEVTGLADPQTMFIIFGLILCIGVIVGIGYSIYAALN
jgi:hypothetical protein